MTKTENRTKIENGKTKLPGPHFVAPDGGWGWVVVLAAGSSNLCILPGLQLFGLLFRDRLAQLEIPNSEITAIINANMALTSCVGLVNGPLFRRFSYRAVSLFGASLVIIGLFLTSIANSFATYLLSFSLLYGSGIGICMSANALALNTYFNKKRRHAVALSWTVTALGPIVMPHIVTILLVTYGVQNTMLLEVGLAMHAVICALLLQPAQWHSKHKDEDAESLSSKKLRINNVKEYESSYCNTPLRKSRSRSIFSSQYLYNDDSTYDIIDTATPMLSRANDGWYSSDKRSLAGSKLSLTSSKKFHMNDADFHLVKSSSQNLSTRPSFASLSEAKSKKASITNLSEIRSRKSSTGSKRQKTSSYTDTIEEVLVDDVNGINNNNKNNLQENRSRKSSVTVTLPEQKHKRQKRQSVVIKIEESEVEDCPSNKAPQDLRENEKNRLQVNDRNYTRENSTSEVTPTFTKSDDSNKNESGSNDIKRKKEFNIETDILKEASKKLEVYAANCDKSKTDMQENHQLLANSEDDYQNKDKPASYSFWQKVVIFFDLDLLKDFTYVNLMLGITLANFTEINFSILTPFVLGDFNLDKEQVAMTMSLLGGMDMIVRFFIPFVAEYLGWENNTFFLIGIMGMAMGRVVLAQFRSYSVILCAAAWIGLNKGLRTVFLALVIPSHVPLQRLPGATGLQLLCAGLLYITAGPLIGWIRDATNYSITLHCLNILTYVTVISWITEKIYRTRFKSGK